MVWVRDERIRETGTFTAPTVIRLDGPAANSRAFANARRANGDPIESGDRCRVTVLVTGVGDVVCSATYNSGAQDTLTLDGSTVQSSSTGGLPTFSAGNACDVYLTTAVPDMPTLDEDGVLVDPTVVRTPAFPAAVVGDLAARLGVQANEAAFPLGAAAAADGLAGLFAYLASASDIADGEDVVANENTSTGRHVRLDVKPWRTHRTATLAAGNSLALFDADVAGRKWLVDAWTTDGAHHARATVIGHASDPEVDVLFERGRLVIELVGVGVRARNDTAAAMSIRHIRPVIG